LAALRWPLSVAWLLLKTALPIHHLRSPTHKLLTVQAIRLRLRPLIRKVAMARAGGVGASTVMVAGMVNLAKAAWPWQAKWVGQMARAQWVAPAALA
jgi:hypothetical protein